MRFVFGVGTKLFIWETTIGQVAMRTTEDSPDEEEEDFKEAPPQDPHGTLNAHLELSPQAVYGEAKARRFGFHGS
jgi:hypothetical protein